MSDTCFRQCDYIEMNDKRQPDPCALTKQLTTRIRETFWLIHPQETSFYTQKAPEFLTERTEEVHNSGLDNEDYQLIVQKGDIIGSSTSIEGRYYSANPESISQYQIIDSIGNGQFGEVFKAKDLIKDRLVAIKILKSDPNFFRQGILEVSMLSIVCFQYS